MKDHDIGVLFKMFDNKENESQTTNITSLAAYQTLLDIEKNNYKKLKAENERLKAENLELLNMCAEQGEKAIKEFAERLKAKALQKFDWNEYVEVEEIDNLVKEMVGDDNA